MAQIRAKDRGDADQRRAWKLRLIRVMYDRGYDRGTVLELFRAIDWMIRLPAEAETAFRKDLYDFETSKQMPYNHDCRTCGNQEGPSAGAPAGAPAGGSARRGRIAPVADREKVRRGRRAALPRSGGDRRQRRPADLFGAHSDGGQHCAGARLSEQVV